MHQAVVLCGSIFLLSVKMGVLAATPQVLRELRLVLQLALQLALQLEQLAEYKE
jgi:hypothetical protein